jgi:filamentous hemagglutinin
LEQRAVAYAVEPGASAAAADAASTIGVPVTRSANPLSPVLEFDAHGNEIMYRTMSPDHLKYLDRTGVLLPTTETSVAADLAYTYPKYTKNGGVTVRFALEPGTSAALQEIGIAANSGAAQALGMAERNGSWMATNARFKVEGGQMTTQLGQGKALDIFNRGIIRFEPVPVR